MCQGCHDVETNFKPIPQESQRERCLGAELDSPNQPDYGLKHPMRLMLPLLALGWGTINASAQWSIFAEKLPAPGHWATYQIEGIKPNEPASLTTIRLSVRNEGIITGKPYVWLSIEPIAWLGSKEKAPLRFLLPQNLDRAGANKLLESAAEIVFSNPVKGAYHMLPEDVTSLSDKVGFKTTNSLEADNPNAELIKLGEKSWTCNRLKMECFTVIDPPFVKKQTIIIRGTVWKDDTVPFGVIQAKWAEKSIKGDKVNEEQKVLTLTGFGKETAPAQALERGDRFSIWKLLFNR